MKEFDVGVIGAGPAGSTVARIVAKKGLRVLVADKENFPRPKTCGGGVTVRAAKLLPFDLQSVTESTAHAMEVSHGHSVGVTRRAPGPITYMVQRSAFDMLLLEQACKQGADFLPGAPIQRVDRVNGMFLVHAGSEVFRCRILVAADGAYGKTAQLAGVHIQHRHGMAMEVEIPLDSIRSELARDTIVVDVGRMRQGFGWIFVKKNHINLGVGGMAVDAKLLRSSLQAFAASRRIDLPSHCKTRSHKLPIRSPGAPLVVDNMMLVGDAAGLVDPLTGEGIYQAIYSGTVAANQAVSYLRDNKNALSGYSHFLEQELVPDLDCGLALSHLLHVSRHIVVPLLTFSDELWDSGFRVLRGEASIRGVEKALGPLCGAARFAWQWYNRRAGSVR